MTRVVLFDMDDTLASEATLGDKNRPLFFPATTKAVFKKLRENGDHIIIASSVTPREEIVSALRAAEIDPDQIQILGSQEVRALEPGVYGRKVTLALSSKETIGATKVVIVEDDTKIDSRDENVVHIQVPFYTDHSTPPSDAYLYATLLPDRQLFGIKPFVQTINSNKKRGQINSPSLDNYYQALIDLMGYRQRREQDGREYFTIWAAWFGGEARSRGAKLRAVDTIVTSLQNGTFDINNIPDAAKNGELSTIVGNIHANSVALVSENSSLLTNS